MLIEKLDVEQLYEDCLSQQEWNPLPDISERSFWNNLKDGSTFERIQNDIINIAEHYQKAPIAHCSASLYMEFMQVGNRVNYEKAYFSKRHALSVLVLSECFENKGNYLPKIIDYLWDIISEPVWCLPSHNFAHTHDMVKYKKINPWKEDDPLPLMDDEYLDLFNCETASLLAEACYLLKPILMETTPSLYHRVNATIEQRVIEKFESNNLYEWYRGINNWAPWCSFNIMNAAMYIIEDKSRLINISLKLSSIVDKFISNLTPQGSCIEGPSYWNISSSRLIGFISLIENRFNINFDIESNKKLVNFGNHVKKMLIGDNFYINFADGAAKAPFLTHGLLWKYADRIDSQQLKNIVLNDLKAFDPSVEGESYNLMQMIRLFKDIPKSDELNGAQRIKLDKYSWLKDMQVMICRESDRQNDGVVLAAIAGNNDLRHNHHTHNDLGNFSVYQDGKPILIDIGPGDYTKDTFSEKRQDKWYISSIGHHVPEINSITQKSNEQAYAHSINFQDNDSKSSLTMEIKDAYQDDSIISVYREIEYTKISHTITVSDKITTDKSSNYVSMPLYFSTNDLSINDNQIIVNLQHKKMVIDVYGMTINSMQTIKLEDNRHVNVWGEEVYKVNLTQETSDCNIIEYKLKINTYS
ncbi:MAG: heparinase II/III family protein [Vibrio sp.]